MMLNEWKAGGIVLCVALNLILIPTQNVIYNLDIGSTWKLLLIPTWTTWSECYLFNFLQVLQILLNITHIPPRWSTVINAPNAVIHAGGIVLCLALNLLLIHRMYFQFWILAQRGNCYHFLHELHGQNASCSTSYNNSYSRQSTVINALTADINALIFN